MTGRGAVWPVAPAVLAAWGLALTIFAPRELGADGALSVGMALRPPIDALKFLRHDVHPPIFYLTLRGWLDLAGHHFLDARWLSLACGALSIVLLYALSRRLLGSSGAWAAAWLFAVAPAFLSSMATVRDFGMGLFLSLLALLLAVRAVDRPSTGRLTAALLLNALALVTWYFQAVFIVAALGYAAASKPRLLPRLLAGCCGVVLLISPWLAFSLPSLLAKVSSGQTFAGGQRAAPRLTDLLGGFGNEALGHLPGWLGLGDTSAAVGIVWLVSLALGLLLLTIRHEWRPASALVAAGALTALGLFWYARFAWVDTNNPGRYFLAALPFLALAQAAIVSAVARRKPFGAAAAAGLVICGLVLGGNEYWRVHTLPPIPYDQDPLLGQLQAVALPDDVAFFSDLDTYGRYLLREPHPVPSYLVHLAGPPHVGDDIPSMIASTIPKLRSGLRVWFVSARPDAPQYNALADTALENAYYYVGQTSFPNNFLLREYATAPTVTTSPAIAGTFGGALRVTAAGHTVHVRPGAVLATRLEWQDAARVDQNYSIFLHLVAPGGAVVAQQDGWPRGGLNPTATWRPGQTVDDRRALIVPSGAPPGAYTLIAGVHTADRQLMLADGQPTLNLGQVIVAP